MNKKLIKFIGVLLVISLCVFVFGQIYQNTLPKLVEEINNSAIGAILTAFVTVLLLQGQTASEMQRDKDVKIFEQKIQVYSKFSEIMWGMMDDHNVSKEELLKLRIICFKELVFFLDDQQIEKISENITKIKKLIHSEVDEDQSIVKYFGEITIVLQNNLNHKQVNNSRLEILFNSFGYNDIKEIKQEEINIKSDRVFWHFNMLYENKQIEALKKGNNVLTLIEYGEEWRTNLVKQVKPGDLVFLFRRGGKGYIGAFEVSNDPYKILDSKESYSDDILKKFDIYEGIDDGATSIANIIVKPLKIKEEGVGYYNTPRRRTIERINDKSAIEYLIEKFDIKLID